MQSWQVLDKRSIPKAKEVWSSHPTKIFIFTCSGEWFANCCLYLTFALPFEFTKFGWHFPDLGLFCRHGEVSRAMRNRCVELCVMKDSEQKDKFDSELSLCLGALGIPAPDIALKFVNVHCEMEEIQKAQHRYFQQTSFTPRHPEITSPRNSQKF